MPRKYGRVTIFSEALYRFSIFSKQANRLGIHLRAVRLKLLHIGTRTIAVTPLSTYCAADPFVADAAPAFAENTVTSTRRFFSRSSFVF